MCLFGFPLAAEARDLPWKKNGFNWSSAKFPSGLTIEDVKKCHEKLKGVQGRMMDALKKDDVEAFVACWPRESESEQYVSDSEKSEGTKYPKEIRDAHKKGIPTVDARHRIMFGQLRGFLVKRFGNIANVELIELTMDDMASGLSPKSGGHMVLRIPMFITSNGNPGHVVSVATDADYFSGNLYLSSSGLMTSIYEFDKSSPEDIRGKQVNYDEMK